MMSAKKIAIACLLFFTFVDAESQPTTAESTANETLLNDFARSYYIQDFGFIVPEKWNKVLYDTIEVWLGTPYCYAGNSQKGVDCSGFVNSLYSKVYQSSIGARNSAAIYKKITKVDKEELSEGDLVFFRMHSRRITHVGLYLGNSKFVHASTSSGVIISDLTDPYYKKFYAGGGHLPEKLVSNEFAQ